ncbi:2-ketogluconate transporter [Klebsiella oxytoca]|nr:2-ketogluconate transporter [Klebsiella oxytoca]
MLWAVCWWILVRDKPSEVSWLNEQEKETLQKVMDSEQSHIKPVRNYGEALRSRNVIMLCAVHALWSIGVYGFMMWMPSILKNAAQMDIVAVGWLAAVPYLAAIILMLTVSWLSDKFQNRKLFIWPLLLIAAIAFFGSWMVGNQAFWLSYLLLVIAAACMYAPYGPFFALIPELLPRNVSGVSMGLINSFGALGAFLGAWLVGYLNGITGGPGVSYTFMAIALLSSVVLMYNVRANPQPATSSVTAKKVAG